MKKLFGQLLFPAALLACILALSNCEKDEGRLPAISFKTGANYTSADATVAPNTVVQLGVTADKTEEKDVLKTLSVTVSYDGAAATTLASDVLTGTQGDHFEKDLSVITRNQVGTEQYTFTVVNRDGLTNSVTLTLTVQ